MFLFKTKLWFDFLQPKKLMILKITKKNYPNQIVTRINQHNESLVLIVIERLAQKAPSSFNICPVKDLTPVISDVAMLYGMQML